MVSLLIHHIISNLASDSREKAEEEKKRTAIKDSSFSNRLLVESMYPLNRS